MKPPKVKEPSPMPDQNDPAIVNRRRKAVEEIHQRSGVASTMLSDAYSKDKLGGF
jgi:hypothetical protein